MIDIHSHVVPLELPFGARGDDRWPRVARRGDGTGAVEIAGRVFRVIPSVSWDMAERIAAMDAAGVTVQAISPMPELFSYWAPPGDAAPFCEALNEWIAGQVQRHPQALVGIGVVPLQDLDLACRALGAVKAAGLAGVEIGSNVGGESVGRPRFLPFYEEAARLGLCVFVHSFHPVLAGEVPPWAVNGVLFPVEAGVAAESLIVNGIVDAVPSARIAVSHGGGTAAFAIPRLEHLWQRDEGLREQLPASPTAQLRRMYFDSMVFSEDALSYLLDVVGHDRVCVGTDYPFFPADAGIDPVRAVHVDEAVRQALVEGNARRYLGLDPGR